MTQLLKFEESDGTTMSSREIAAITGKEHKNVLRDCDKLQEHYDELGLPKFEQGSFLHPSTGTQEHREFKLTKMQTFDLITGYDAKLRIQVNRRWEELEKRNRAPQTRLQVARQLVEALEREEQLALKVDNLQTVLDIRLDWVSIIKVAQHNRISEKKIDWHKLKRKSEDLGYEIKRASSPRYKYQNLYHINVFKAAYPELRYDIKEE